MNGESLNRNVNSDYINCSRSMEILQRLPVISHDDVYDLGMKLHRRQIKILHAKPGDPWFPLWFIVSCYMPVVTACVGPLAHMTSIAGIWNRWRKDEHYLRMDAPIFESFNALSLAIGFASNIILLLNFSKKVSYVRAQFFGIFGWFIAGAILVVDLTVFRHFYKGETTENYWFAVITCGLYFLCSVTLILHYMGYYLGQYPPKFNLEDNERGVMYFTSLLSIWFIWGAFMFSKVMHIRYGNALYFCVESLLTIGLGDIYPHTNLARALILVYSNTGLIILGLIIAMTSKIVTSTSGPILFWHYLEKQRVSALKSLALSDQVLSSKESFILMKNITKKAKQKRKRDSLIVIASIFTLFWLIGALSFCLIEEWSYFDSIYFCFLCALSIGFGDFKPKKPAGRAFFVLWTITSVPLMTTIISTVGNNFYRFGQNLGSYFTRATGLLKTAFPIFAFGNDDKQCNTVRDVSYIDTSNPEDPLLFLTNIDTSTNRSNTTNSSAARIPEDIYHQRVNCIFSIVKSLRVLASNLRNHTKHLSYAEWNKYYSTFDDNSTLTDMFWITELSPLRVPIDDSRFMFAKLFQQLEVQLNELLDFMEDAPTNQLNTKFTREPIGRPRSHTM